MTNMDIEELAVRDIDDVDGGMAAAVVIGMVVIGYAVYQYMRSSDD